MDKVNQKMKKNFRNFLDGFRGAPTNSATRVEPGIEETIQSEHFQVAKTVRHGFPHQPTALAYDCVQHLLAIGTKSGSITIFGRPGVDCHMRHEGEWSVLQLIFLINEGALLSVCSDDQIHLWSFRQKKPEIIHSLKFQRERIMHCHLPFRSKWLYVGTERGNVHVVNIESFQLSGYIINWNKAIDILSKNHPGPVLHLSDCPADQNKLLIGYETGLIVLWDLKTRQGELRFKCQEALRSISWHNEGKQFVCCHVDGSITIWNLRSTQRPHSTLIPHAKLGKDGKPDVCRPITKVDYKTTKTGDPFIIFSGGMPQEMMGRTPSLTVMHGSSTTVLEMEYPIVDFLTISSSPWSSEIQDPLAVIVLLQNDLVITDLHSPGYPCFENPYPMDLHESPVTTCQYLADCPPDLIPALYSVGCKQKPPGYSDKEWPVRGGEWGASCSYSEIVITGHADGSVKFWDSSSVTMQVLYKLKTGKVFDETRCMSLELNTSPFTVQHVYMCVESKALVVAGLTHVVMFKYCKQENTLELPVLEIDLVGDGGGTGLGGGGMDSPGENDKFNLSSAVPGITILQPPSNCEPSDDRDTSVRIRGGGRKWPPGHQPELCCLLTWNDMEPPSPISALTFNSKYGLVTFGNEVGVVVVDVIQKVCLISLSTAQLYGSVDPFLRTQRSPRNKNTIKPSEGSLSQQPTPDGSKSPIIEQPHTATTPSISISMSDLDTYDGSQSADQLKAKTQTSIASDSIQKLDKSSETFSKPAGDDKHVKSHSVLRAVHSTDGHAEKTSRQSSVVNKGRPVSMTADNHSVTNKPSGDQSSAGVSAALDSGMTGDFDFVYKEELCGFPQESKTIPAEAENSSEEVDDGMLDVESELPRKRSNTVTSRKSVPDPGVEHITRSSSSNDGIKPTSNSTVSHQSGSRLSTETILRVCEKFKRKGSTKRNSDSPEKIVETASSKSSKPLKLKLDLNTNASNVAGTDSQFDAGTPDYGEVGIPETARPTYASLQLMNKDHSGLIEPQTAPVEGPSVKHFESLRSGGPAKAALSSVSSEGSKSKKLMSFLKVVTAGMKKSEEGGESDEGGLRIGGGGDSSDDCFTAPPTRSKPRWRKTFEYVDLTSDDLAVAPPIRRLTYLDISPATVCATDKTDGNTLPQSQSSSVSSLESCGKESVVCLHFAQAYARRTDVCSSASLWIGTSQGAVLVLMFSFGDNNNIESRSSKPITVSLSGTVFKLKGSIRTLSFLDCSGILITNSSDNPVKDISRDDTHAAHIKEKKPYYRQQSVANMKVHLSPTPPDEVTPQVDHQFLIICSDKQARVLALPSQTCAYKVKITETSCVAKAEVVPFKDSLVLCCFLMNGHIMTFSLPSLRPLLDVDYLPLPNVRVIQTFCFSINCHALYFCSPSELQKLTLSAEMCESLKEMVGELFIPCDMPEAPKQGFLKSLFNVGNTAALDREELFGETSSGKAARGVAKYSSGMSAAQESAGVATSEISRARQAAMERGERLGELEDKTEQMRNEAERFSQYANQLKNKYRDKKWYQF